MNEPTKLNLQALGCLFVFTLLIFFFERTVRFHWQLWLAAAAVILLVLTIWAALSRRRARKLDAEYGFSIVYLGMRTGKIEAFHEGVVAFSIPVDYDSDPTRINFTAALIDIPVADREAWRERLTEYLNRRWKRYVIV